MTITVVDKVNGHEIRKLHPPKGDKTFGYQAVPFGYDGTDPSQIKEATTLHGARCAVGWKPAPKGATPDAATLPKWAHPQNRNGYRADSAAKSSR